MKQKLIYICFQLSRFYVEDNEWVPDDDDDPIHRAKGNRVFVIHNTLWSVGGAPFSDKGYRYTLDSGWEVDGAMELPFQFNNGALISYNTN